MKAIRVNWPNTPERDGVLFFAQVADELLFDFSAATYRLPTLNTPSRLEEAVEIVSRVLRDDMNSYHIPLVIDEVVDTLRSDPVSKEILGAKTEWAIQQLADKADHNKQRSVLTYLMRAVSDQYRPVALRMLRELVPEGKEKNKICRIIRGLLVTFTQDGYSKEAIYYCLQRVFFTTDIVNCENSFHAFLDYFSEEPKKIKVYARVSQSIVDLISTDENFLVKKGDDLDGATALQRERFTAQPGETVYADISAFDSYSAVNRMREWLAFLEATLLFYHHEAKNETGQCMYIKSEDEAQGYVISERSSEMTRARNVKLSKASALSRETITFFASGRSKAFSQKVFASLLGHANATKMATPDSQLITLWSALETFLPRKKFSATTNQFTQYVVPAVCLGYLRHLFEAALLKFRSTIGHEFWAVAKEVPVNGGVLEKFAAAVILPEYSEYLERLMTLCANNPLARYRLFQMHDQFKSGKGIRAVYFAHRSRVEWQVLRIYRARNEIIHDGKKPPFIVPLLSNLHEYFDVLVSNFDRYAKRTPSDLSTYAVFADLLSHSAYFESLLEKAAEGGKELSADAFAELLVFA